MIRTSITIGGNRIPDNEVLSVSLSQAIGKHHQFEIHLRSDVSNRGLLDDRLEAWMGKQIKIGIGEKEEDFIASSLIEDTFIGIVLSVSLARRSGETAMVLKGSDPSITIDDGPVTRSYTDKTLEEITNELLTCEATIVVDPQMFTEAIPYVVQYNESNFDFVCRLADRYGDWFYYDGSSLHYGFYKDSDPILLDFGRNGLVSFDLELRALPTNFKIIGYDYTKHKTLEKESPYIQPTSERATKVWDTASKVYKESPVYALTNGTNDAELSYLTDRRGQVNMDEIEVISGVSTNMNLKLGNCIHVTDDLTGEDYGIYRIYRLNHFISQGGEYQNSFEAVPEELLSPPLEKYPSTPFCGTQLGKVTDTADEDSLGRVKVELLWQEGTGETTPWLRVASPYTGKDKGFYIIPEKDDQVLVAFEGNNPDKPYVLTGMYNNDAKPEWFDPKNQTKGFKTKGKNELKFDDKSKSITLYAPDTITLKAGKKIILQTGNDDKNQIIIDGTAGTMIINAKSSVTTSTDKLELTAKSEVTAKAMEFLADASVGAELKGTTVKVSGAAKVDVTSPGPVSVTGAMVNLNS